MSSSSTIEWTDATWNPVVGCTHCSAGCDNCYAAREASGRLKNTPTYTGLAVDGQFTGEIRLLPERLDQPLHWSTPRRVFVNSMSDLFHRDVPDDFIAEVFVRMQIASQHTYQVLTKRPQRMARLLADPAFGASVMDRACHQFVDVLDQPVWPPPWVWLGTSVEDQRHADLRIPHLLDTPACVRFVSIEPLLGPVDLRPRPPDQRHLCIICGEGPEGAHDHAQGYRRKGLDWVIVGGESGPKARPMHPEWVRQLRDQCAGAGVPFFFKQWGEWIELPAHDHRAGFLVWPDGSWGARLGLDLSSIAEGGGIHVGKMGKKFAGRELDGRTWDEMPEHQVFA